MPVINKKKKSKLKEALDMFAEMDKKFFKDVISGKIKSNIKEILKDASSK